VIFAGVPCDFRINYGRNIPRSATYVSINRDKVDLYKNRKPEIAILADPAEFIVELAKNLESSNNNNNTAYNTTWKSWVEKLTLADQQRDKEIAKEAEEVTEYVNPLKVFQVLDKVASENSIFVADGGDFVGTAAYILRPRKPLSWIDPGPFGTLGVGSGFALGAKLCSSINGEKKDDTEVWIIFGDGACGFSLIEFDTMVRHGIPVIAVVGNDGAWAQIVRDQIKTFKTEVGGKLSQMTNYHDAVKGLGAEGFIVKSTDELESTFLKAKEVAKTKPVLINILIGKTSFRDGSISV